MASYSVLLILLLLPSLLPSATATVDINKILSQFPEFSSFSSLLTQTQVAAAIDSRQTITVLAVDNAAASSLSSQPADIQKKLLAVHVILDYYDDAKLKNLPNKTAILTTMFQSSGQAIGKTGFLNATVPSSGGVVFGSAVPGSPVDSSLVKVVVTHPYNISVLQVSKLIVPPGVGSGIANSNGTSSPSPSPSASNNSSATPTTAPSKAPSTSPASAPAPGKESNETSAAAPAPGDSAAAPAPGDSDAAPAPGDSDAAAAPGDSAAAPAADTPGAAPPSPPAPAKGTHPSIADAPAAPAPEKGGKSPSAAGRVVAGAGVALAVGAGFLGMF